jgi:hypothetical protein
VNKRTKVIVIAFVLTTSAIATSALGQSDHTWYDGGGEIPQDSSVSAFFTGHGEPTCQKTNEGDSPAESYKNLQYFGSQPQIIDKGDEVDIQGSDGTIFRFFRTQKACKHFAAQLHAKAKAQQNEERKTLNRYE